MNICKSKERNTDVKKIVQSGNFSDNTDIQGFHWCEIKSTEQIPLPKNHKSYNFILKDGRIGRIASITQVKNTTSIQFDVILNDRDNRNASFETFFNDNLLLLIKEFL